MEILIIVISSILMIAGVAGVILPFLPGVLLVWLGFFIYAAATSFESISLVSVLVFLVLSIIASSLDLLAPVVGAKKYKAGKEGIIGAFLGSLVGVAIFGFWGVILGPAIGAVLGEFVSKRNLSFVPVLGTVFGFFASIIIRLVLSFVIIGFFIFSFF
jgi:hypothetical protein